MPGSTSSAGSAAGGAWWPPAARSARGPFATGATISSPRFVCACSDGATSSARSCLPSFEAGSTREGSHPSPANAGDRRPARRVPALAEALDERALLSPNARLERAASSAGSFRPHRLRCAAARADRRPVRQVAPAAGRVPRAGGRARRARSVGWAAWFYQYVFMLLALAFTAPERAANTCRLILVSIYFWSGLQKLNPGFFHDTFPWLMEPITRHVHADALLQFAFVVPLVETGIGIALLTRRTRKPALIVAAAMHGFILLMIGPLGQRHNSVVWSWNIVIALAAFLLFWKAPDFSARDVLQPRGARFHALVLALFTVAPALSFFNAWDHYLSWSLYSGNKTDADIYMTDAVANKLPGEVLEFVTEEGPDRNGLNIHEWRSEERRVG